MMKYIFEPCFLNITNENEYIKKISDTINSGSKGTFFYLNSHSYYLANKNSEFREAFNKADFIIADGYSIVWAIKKLTSNKIDKVVFTYSFFSRLHKLFEELNTRIFMLGGTEEIISKSSEIFKLNYSNINVVGAHHGFFDKEEETYKIIELINSSKANVLIVGMGMPITEIWIQENFNRINANLIFSVGGFFEFLTKNKKMAPGWIYNSGLEWLFRLLQEPKRLIGRYFIANPYLIYKVILLKLKKR